MKQFTFFLLLGYFEIEQMDHVLDEICTDLM